MTNILLIILCVIGVFVLIFILALIKKLTSLEDRIDEVRDDAAPLMERLRYGNTPFGFVLGLLFGGKKKEDPYYTDHSELEPIFTDTKEELKEAKKGAKISIKLVDDDY